MPTSTSFAVGLAFLTSSATLAFSASVKLAGSLTGVLAGSLTPSASLVVGSSGLELGSFGSVPFSTSSLSVTPSPSVSALVGSVPFSASSLSVKPSPSVSLVDGFSGELGSSTVTLTGTSSLEPSG